MPTDKPTRAGFTEEVLRGYPGAQVSNSNRGLLITVGTLEIAVSIMRLANAKRLNVPHPPDTISPDCITLHVFGFRREERL